MLMVDQKPFWFLGKIAIKQNNVTNKKTVTRIKVRC